LNLLSVHIPDNERVLTIEDSAELRIDKPNVARLETRPPNLEGAGEVTTRDLLRNALRMRPDRIIIGECRQSEAFDMLQAMNTGHDGSLTTIHANTPRDALGRLQLLVGLAGCELSPEQIDRHIASAIQLVVQVARLPGGCRKVIKISEVVGIKNGQIALQDVFEFMQQGIDEKGVAIGRFVATGAIPLVLKRLREFGVPIDERMFVSGASPKASGVERVGNPAENVQ
jgi:pilus assembly protein CpaF